MHASLLADISLSIVTATALAYLAWWAGQPLLLAYIGAGVLIGPIGLALVTDPASIQTLAELGLAFLLFIVGLEIDVKKLADSGKVAVVATLVQVVGSGALGWLVARGLGYDGLAAGYIGVAVAFSSTMIVVKVLSDLSELDTVAGRVTLGILLFQDVLAVVVLAVQAGLDPRAGGGSPLATIGLSAVKGIGLIGGSFAVSRWILPALFRSVARSPEIVLLSAVSWCFVVCQAATLAGFSIAMGALVAGITLSGFPYVLDVVAKLRSLRDFFVTLFFVSLGMLITRPDGALLMSAAVLSILVIVTRLLFVPPALLLLGYDNRVGVVSGLHLGQTSEFALVIALIGVSPELHHITPSVVSLVVITLVVTATASTYLIQFSHPIASAVVRMLVGTPLEDRHSREGRGARPAVPLVLIGCFRVGSSVLQDLTRSGRQFTVIDFSPTVHEALRQMGIRSTYGDLASPDTLQEAGVEHADVVVSSTPDDFLRGTDNRTLLEAVRRVNPRAKVIVAAESIEVARQLYAAGADFVLIPRLLAADHLLRVIEGAENGQLAELRAAEMARLAGRQEVVP